MSYNSWFEWAETLIPSAIPRREYYKIGEVAELVSVKPYVLRYWETEFGILSPQKTGGNQRIYRYRDLAAAFLIKFLLYNEKFSIDGARKKVKSFKDEVKRPESDNISMTVAEVESFDSAIPTGPSAEKRHEAVKMIDDLIGAIRSL